jgi:hypothetical protein
MLIGKIRVKRDKKGKETTVYLHDQKESDQNIIESGRERELHVTFALPNGLAGASGADMAMLTALVAHLVSAGLGNDGVEGGVVGDLGVRECACKRLAYLIP